MSTATRLVTQASRTIKRFAMFVPGERVLVAISGGPDSTALLAVLAAVAEAEGIELCAAHFNHRARGAEADRDEKMAQEIARTFGLPLARGFAATPLPTANFEAHARSARYAFLQVTADQGGCQKIATGHTRDDQAETVLMRLLRGCGIDGLTGILPVRRDGVVRPLIECCREEVLEFLQARHLPFVADSSNEDTRYLRSRVRLEILPLMARVNPKAADALANIAEMARETANSLQACVAAATDAARSSESELGIAALLALHPALLPQVLRAWLSEQRGGLAGISARHLTAGVRLVRSARPHGAVALPGGGLLERVYDNLIYRPEEFARSVWGPVPLCVGERLISADGWIFDSVERSAGASGLLPEHTQYTFVADVSLLPGQLTFRTVRLGDRIQPFGMTGSRKLQDVFVDRRVPRHCRWSHPVLVAGDHMLWVPGVVRSAIAAVSGSTRSVLEIKAVPPR